MQPGISTACFYPLETEKSLHILLEKGFRVFEIFFNTDSEVTPQACARLRARLDAYGARLYSLHPYTSGFEPVLFFSEYPARFADAVAWYRRYFAAAASLGARVFVFHGNRKELPLPMEVYCERFAALAAAAKQEGVVLAQENVSRCASAKVSAVCAMRRILGRGNIRFVFDVKQAVRAGEDPFAMLDAMGGDVINVHLSDHSKQGDCLLPGKGDLDIVRLREKLAFYGYEGPLLIEVYRTGFTDESEISEAYTHLKNLLGHAGL